MEARMESHAPWKFVAAECGDQHATSVRSPEPGSYTADYFNGDRWDLFARV
jgi:hypothetical protein